MGKVTRTGGDPRSPIGLADGAGRAEFAPADRLALPYLAWAALGAVAVVGGGWAALLAADGWVAGAAASRLFALCAAVLLTGTIGLAWLGRYFWLVGLAERRRRRDGEGGTVLIEFVLLLPIALMIVMVMAQSSLLMGANLSVHYAAYCAARSAIVWVPRPGEGYPHSADEIELGYEPPNLLSYDDRDSTKMRRIRDAAVWACMPISYGGEDQVSADDGELPAEMDRLFAAYGEATPGWLDDRIGRKFAWARDHTRIDVRPPDDDAHEDPGYGQREDIRVTVEHTYYMPVPYAGRVFAELDGDGVELPDGGYGLRIRATCVLPNEGPQDWIDIEHFPITDTFEWDDGPGPGGDDDW